MLETLECVRVWFFIALGFKYNGFAYECGMSYHIMSCHIRVIVAWLISYLVACLIGWMVGYLFDVSDGMEIGLLGEGEQEANGG